MQPATVFFAGYGLFFVIGLAPFMMVNALFAEVQVFVTTSPEGKATGAVIGAAYNVANIAPLLFLWLRRIHPIRDTTTVAVLFTLAAADALLTAFVWRTTALILGAQHSIGLIATAFISGVVGCTCNMAIFNLAAQYRRVLTSALSAGMAGSGLLTALLAITQGIGAAQQPAFSVPSYFFVVFACNAAALVALGVVRVPRVAAALARRHAPPGTDAVNGGDSSQHGDADDEYGDEDEAAAAAAASRPLMEPPGTGAAPARLTWAQLALRSHAELVSMLASSLMNYFVLPGLAPYMVGQYAYRIAYIIAALAVSNLAGRVVGGSAAVRARVGTPYRPTAVQLLLFAVLVTVAATASHTTESMGVLVLILLACGAFSGLNGYVVTAVYLPPAARQHALAREDHDLLLRWTGLMTQAGSLGGSFLCAAVVPFLS